MSVRPVAVAVHAATVQLLRDLRVHDVELGLGTARASVLSVVVFARRPLSINELAKVEQVRAPTMTRLVDRLQAAGLVARRRDEVDRRHVWVSPTARGLRVMLAGRERRVAALSRKLEDLSARELRVLEEAARIMERVTSKDR